MQSPFSRFAIAFTVSLLLIAPALAIAVTSADLDGKKICYDNGTETYSSDGKYVSTTDGHGTWTITDKGVEIKTNQITGLADMQKLPDGTITSTWIVNGKPETWAGHYCE
jgi:hypothetical protein